MVGGVAGHTGLRATAMDTPRAQRTGASAMSFSESPLKNNNNSTPQKTARGADLLGKVAMVAVVVAEVAVAVANVPNN